MIAYKYYNCVFDSMCTTDTQASCLVGYVVVLYLPHLNIYPSAIKQLLSVVINILSRITYNYRLLTCFCMSLNNVCTDSRMQTTRCDGFIEGDESTN